MTMSNTTGETGGLGELRAAIRGERTLREQFSAITRAGKEYGPQGLEADVRQLLHHPDPNLRTEALFTLGVRWRLPDIENLADQLWRSADAPDAERSTALQVWYSYHRGSGDPAVVADLMAVLTSHQHSSLRATALDGIASVASPNPGLFLEESGRMLRADAPAEVDALIPWSVLETLDHVERPPTPDNGG